MMDILIVKLGALGDVINTLPLVNILKTDLKCRISWLVEPLSYPIVSEHPHVDRAILFDKQRWRSALPDLLRQSRDQTFDIAIDLQRILKSGMLCIAARAKRHIGFDKKRCKEMTWLFPFERISESDPGAHMVCQYLEFASHLGVPTDNVRWEIPVSNNHPIGLPGDYCVLNIGATKPANKWTEQGFASLAYAVQQRFSLASVLTGGKEDIGMARKIAAMADQKVIDLVGKTSINELKEVLAGSRAVVSCDTGPLHLAVALGRNVVALFGPSDPRRTGPFRGQVIQKPLYCSPCNLRQCRDPVCMKAITHEDVMERLQGVLQA